MRIQVGTLAGISNGRRRRGLGEAWDCRYHRYLDTPSGYSFSHRPTVHLRSGSAVCEVSKQVYEDGTGQEFERTAAHAEQVQRLRHAS